jgi:hypothetical protein
MGSDTMARLDADERRIEDDFDSWHPLPTEEKSWMIYELSNASVRKPALHKPGPAA